MKKTLVKLLDNNWYPVLLHGSTAAGDYEGQRYNVSLINPVDIIDPKNGNTYSYPSGVVLRECHKDCIKLDN